MFEMRQIMYYRIIISVHWKCEIINGKFLEMVLEYRNDSIEIQIDLARKLSGVPCLFRNGQSKIQLTRVK